MLRDFVNNVRAHAGNDGDSIDLRDFDSVAVFSTADLDGVVEVSDEAASGFAAAPADDLIAIDGNGSFAVGYIGDSRYLRVTGDDAAQSVVVGYHLHRKPDNLSIAQ